MNRREVIGATLMGATGLAVAKEHATTTHTQDEVRSTRIRKGYVDGPFGQIHYYSAGDGPTLIMAHQSPVSGRAFEQAMPYLSQFGVRAIAVDTPGYGNSDAPDEPPTIPEYADAFHAVLDGLGLDNAHFLGHHTGASILCSFAARNPDRVRSLILHGSPLMSAEELKDARELIAPGPHAVHADGTHLQARWDRRVRFSPGWTDKEAMHRRLVDQLWAGDKAWFGHHAALRYEMQPDLMAVKNQTLILTNTGEGSNAESKRAHALRPDFAFHEIEGGTHDIVDEKPRLWSKVVADYVLANS